MNSDIFDNVKRFTIDKAAVEDNDVTGNTSLETDLGIYGDDANEYILAFGKEFNVDVSRFMAADYFSPEGGFKLPPAIIRFLEPRKSQSKRN